MAKKTNWDKVKDRRFEDQAAYRDVHDSQNLNRGAQGDISSKTGRRVAAILIGILAVFVIFFVCIVAINIWTLWNDLITPSDDGSNIFMNGPNFSTDMMTSWKVWMVSLVGGLLMWLIMNQKMMLSWESENSMNDQTDINPHTDDQYVMLPEEIQRAFDWFPDAGAHSAVAPSSMISHIAIDKKGIKSVKVPKRYKKDTVLKFIDDDGNEVTEKMLKGEIMTDDDGETIYEKVPLIDEEFGQELFSASGIPAKEKDIRKPYQVVKVPYNPKNEEGVREDRDKLAYDTVGDLINNDWEFPEYETQRPAGAYIVDTAPVNTMVLAITRAGKGQTLIEPTIDMWTREKRQHNILVNDPKGELLVKFFVPATVRGYEVVQFNLINSMKTDIYNPLGYAANAAREGDFTQAAAYVENIGDVFFPKEGADDPMWPNAANNAFKRSAFGLIDYYLEEEKQLRRDAEKHGTDPKIVAQAIDDMWGKVTLYNAYQLFVILSAKKSSDESIIKIDEDEVVKEKDYLTLFFDATAKLPRNSMRNLVRNTDNALRAMAGSDKTIASVYGIALTAMSFFTDPTISTLTSGKPSQNFDAQGLSFPRRVGVRFSPEYMARNRVTGNQAIWSAYEDSSFKRKLLNGGAVELDDGTVLDKHGEPLPKDAKKPKADDFEHKQLIDTTGWARYFFDGKFKKRKAYLKLEIRNPETQLLIKTFYFELELMYKTSLNGKSYVKDPVLNTKIIKDGVLRELHKRKDGKFGYRQTMVDKRYREILSKDDELKVVKVPAFTQTTVNYTERPKMVFLITPPHLMSYAKLILILVKQMVDVNFSGSYMTKSNQKPLYKTRYMLDELGNLQSEGHGIPALQTMLSIGLGQEQQFTLILQTLQQLRDVYGDSVDKIIQGNTNNIVFLKSTDDAMLETLSKLSGKTHESLVESKTITRDNERILNRNEGKISYTMATKERPVIRFEDLLFMAERNSVVYRAGSNPIWNRNRTILPMSWRLNANTIKLPGKEFSLQTVPTLSSAMEFDIKKNQPDFYAMLDKRLKQAQLVDQIRQRYQEVYAYSEHEMEQLDEDVLSDELMDAINSITGVSDHDDVGDEPMWQQAGYSSEEAYYMDLQQEQNSMGGNDLALAGKPNVELEEEVAMLDQQVNSHNQLIYGNGLLSYSMFMSEAGQVNGQLNRLLSEAYQDSIAHFERDTRFRVDPDTKELYDANRNTLFVKSLLGVNRADYERLSKETEEENSRVFGEDEANQNTLTFEVTDDFIRYLVSLDTWSDIANGRFDAKVGALYRNQKMF